MTNHSYFLINRNGGFESVSETEYKAWIASPSQACKDYPKLLERLHRQTHGRGFNYEDYTPHHRLESGSEYTRSEIYKGLLLHAAVTTGFAEEYSIGNITDRSGWTTAKLNEEFGSLPEMAIAKHVSESTCFAIYTDWKNITIDGEDKAVFIFRNILNNEIPEMNWRVMRPFMSPSGLCDYFTAWAMENGGAKISYDPATNSGSIDCQGCQYIYSLQEGLDLLRQRLSKKPAPSVA